MTRTTRSVSFAAALALATVIPALAAAQRVASGPAAAAQGDPYADYTPGSCVQAIARISGMHWRTGPDTTRPNYVGAQMLLEGTAAARECLVHFTPSAVIPRDLVLLAEVQLAAGDDSAAARSIARRLAADAKAAVAVRARTLADVVEAYITAQPHHVTLARQYLAKLDALSSRDALVGKVMAHEAMLRHYKKALDDPAAAREAETIIAFGKQLGKIDRMELLSAVDLAYKELVRQAGDNVGGDSAHAVLARAHADIGKIGDAHRELTRLDSVYALYGRHATRLVGQRWIGADSGAVRPTRGKVSVIIFGADRHDMPMLGRLKAEFGDALEITLANRTVGYFRGQGPFSTEVELDSLSRYLREELHAPGAIVLSSVDFKRRPDGRLIRPPTPNEAAYKVPDGVRIIVVDQKGAIRSVQQMDVWRDELRLETAIKRLMSAR